MRLLYVVRLFSGLKESLLSGVWQPRGVPTIYRMIEALDRSSHDVRFVFTNKDADGWPYNGNRTFHVQGLRRPVTVLSGDTISPLKWARGYFRELSQAFSIWRLKREFQPDLVYFDRVNIYPAALTARLSRTPVVWRVMGVPPAMHALLKATGIVAALTRAAYRMPFAHVICSRDGSGGESWMERGLAPSTPRTMAINGADDLEAFPLAPEIKAQLPAERTKVLFVGRLVDDKGCLPFMQGFLSALAQAQGRLQAVIAGDGPYAASMHDLAAANGALDHVSFLGQVPHNQIAELHKCCDIYVSLNPMGNLTNANLEALRCGACMVIPAAQHERGIDTDTEEFIPEDAALRVPSPDDAEALAAASLRLHHSPDERAARSARAREIAGELIPRWDDRIAWEIRLLETLARQGRAGHAPSRGAVL